MVEAPAMDVADELSMRTAGGAPGALYVGVSYSGSLSA